MKKLFTSLLVAILYLGSTQAQLNMTQLGNLTYTPELSDIWGYVDSLGNEYALVGVGNGVSVVDVTTPTAPTEVYFISGPSSVWRDLKVWNKHLYVTNESSGGLMIIDLSNLPNPAFPTVVSYSGSTYPFTSAHDIFIDENGVAYVMGADNGNGGAIMLDLTIDPQAPVELGRFNTNYLHDGMVRGDTLWGAAINDGIFVVVNVSNKSAPIVMATQNTPGNLTHNCWISDDGNNLFTTDEISNAFIGSYDVSNLSNITLEDQVQSNPGTNTIVHNTYVIGNFIVTSYYRDGVTIHDVTRPHNLIETGNFDSSPGFAGSGFNGAWGVYPWLPSGNVIVSDIENGLFVLGATYVQGCYLEGTVTDSISGLPINNATIQILATSLTTTSNISGDYATATLTPGTFNVLFSAPGYTSDTLVAILSNGVLTILDAVLLAPTPFTVTGQVIEATMGAPVPGASVTVTNNDVTYNVTADGSGNFTITPFYAGTYDIIGGKWLFKSTCFSMYIDSANANGVIELDSGIYDDFSFDYGWTVTGSAVSGVWEKGEPIGTTFGGGDANPELDVTTDCYEEAYITGNAGGGAGNDDVDNGNTILTSPVFDLSPFTEPYVNYYRWFFNDGGSGTPNDELEIRLYNGTSSAIIETVTESSAGNGTWVQSSIKVSDFITASSTMQLIFETSDLNGSGHLVEAGVDQFEVGDYGLNTTLTNASCFGVCDGEGTATVEGGQSPFTYFWDDPGTQTNAAATGLCAGLYNIVVIDAAGDSAVGSVSINQPNQITLWTSTYPTCTENVSDAIVTALAGASPYTYLWSDSGAQTTQTATGLNMATYGVTVTDNNGCSNSTTVSIGANSVISVMASGTNPTTCGGSDGSAAAVATNGSAPYTYLWDDLGMQTTAIALGLTAGIYKVIATDDDGCSDSSTVSLTDAGAATLSISDSAMVSCLGPGSGSVTVMMNGGVAPYTYIWNTSPIQTNSIATGLSVGTYAVTVTDSTGCSNSMSVNITALVDISATATFTNPSACGAADGAATAAAIDGLPPYTYLWSDAGAQTSAVAAGLLSGNYTVTVSDNNGCTDVVNITLNDPGAPTLTSMGTTMPSCFGGSDGTATVAASGGTTPYTYAWGTTPAQSNAIATGLSANTYNVSVTDAGFCVSSTMVLVSEPTALDVVISKSDISCFGANNGAASVSVNGGTAPYGYSWDTGDSTVPLINLSAGTYTLTVTDDNGCTSTESVTFTEPAQMTLSTSITNATFGSCNGVIAVGVTGGIPPFIYSWNDPGTQTTAIAAGLCAGSYTVVVTDSSGCTQTAAGVVQLLDAIAANASNDYRLLLYPNPNTGSFILDLILKHPGEVRLELLNSIGQVIYEEKLRDTRSHALNIPDVSSGVYQLRIITSTEVFQKKVVVNR